MNKNYPAADQSFRRIGSDDSAEFGTDCDDNTAVETYSRRSMLCSVGTGVGMLLGHGKGDVSEANGLHNLPEYGTGINGEEQVRGSQSCKKSMQMGIYHGSDAATIKQTETIETWIGSRFDIQNIFIPWDDARYELDDLFGSVLPIIWNAGRTPLITWELYLSSGPTPDNILERVIAGEYDNYLTEWAKRLNTAIERTDVDQDNQPAVYIRLAHEANGDWYPWAPAGGDGTPEDYIAMWRYVQSYIEERCDYESHLAWMWAVNGADIGPYTMEDIYPGDSYVDWLGVDNYNWGTSQSWSRWESPEELFCEPIERVRALGDSPISVPEFGSSSATQAGNDVQRKSIWIRKSFQLFDELGVEMAVWFNEEETIDWSIFGKKRGTDQIEINGQQYDVYPVYKEMVLEAER